VYIGIVTVSEVGSKRDGTSIPGRNKLFFSSNKLVKLTFAFSA
jgi:hypothetical protein